MRNIQPLFSTESIQEAIGYLDDQDKKIDLLANVWRGDYQTARTTVLEECMKLTESEAQTLLEQVDDQVKKSAQKIQAVKSLVSNIQKDPYDLIVDQFTSAYNCFFKEHNLDITAPIPKKFLDTLIFEYFTVRGERQCIFLSLARLLLNPRRKIDCRKFFVSAIEGTKLRT